MSSKHASYLQALTSHIAAHYANHLGDGHPVVVELRRTAVVVGLMSGLDASQEWDRQRRALPWWRRLSKPSTAPTDFKDAFIREQQSQATADYLKAAAEDLSRLPH